MTEIIPASSSIPEYHYSLNEMASFVNKNFQLFLKTIFYKRGIPDSYTLTEIIPSDFNEYFTLKLIVSYEWKYTFDDWNKGKDVGMKFYFVKQKTSDQIIENISEIFATFFSITAEINEINRFCSVIMDFINNLATTYLSPIDLPLQSKIIAPLYNSIQKLIQILLHDLTDKISVKFREVFLYDKNGYLFPFAFSPPNQPLMSFILDYSIYNTKDKTQILKREQIDFLFFKSMKEFRIFVLEHQEIFRLFFINSNYLYNPFSPCLYNKETKKLRIPLIKLSDFHFQTISHEKRNISYYYNDLETYNTKAFTTSLYYLELSPYSKDNPFTSVIIYRGIFKSYPIEYVKLHAKENPDEQIIITQITPAYSYAFEECPWEYSLHIEGSNVFIGYNRKDQQKLTSNDIMFLNQYIAKYKSIRFNGKTDYSYNLQYNIKFDQIDRSIRDFYSYYKWNSSEPDWSAYLISKIRDLIKIISPSNWNKFDEIESTYFTFTFDKKSADFEHTINFYADYIQVRYIYQKNYAEFILHGWFEVLHHGKPFYFRMKRSDFLHNAIIPFATKKVLDEFLNTDHPKIQHPTKPLFRVHLFEGKIIFGNKSTESIFSKDKPLYEGIMDGGNTIDGIYLGFNLEDDAIETIVIKYSNHESDSNPNTQLRGSDIEGKSIFSHLLILENDDNLELSAISPQGKIPFPALETESKPSEPKKIEPIKITEEEIEERDETTWFLPIPKVIFNVICGEREYKVQLNLTSETIPLPYFSNLANRKILSVENNILNTEIRCEIQLKDGKKQYIAYHVDDELDLTLIDETKPDTTATFKAKILSWKRDFDEGELLVDTFPDPFEVNI